jgi:predicted TIM-barrel enzyme
MSSSNAPPKPSRSFAQKCKHTLALFLPGIFLLGFNIGTGSVTAMAKAGADSIIAHVGTTVGGSIGVVGATVNMDVAIEKTQAIIDAVKRVNEDMIFLAHGGPINTPDDVKIILEKTEAHGFVGASSLERMAVESSLTELTQKFKSLTLE